jgi:hypothetical protein
MKEFLIERWGVESTGESWARTTIKSNELIARYEVDGGCPGDDLTPPDPPSVTITGFFIEVFEKGVGTLTIPVPDIMLNSLDIRELEDRIAEDLSTQ